MISGNGRHRRPRQAPALLVAAGVTGSAIAIPLLGAASAHAADGTTWDKVANCESGGAWSADPGNGYYGGLQISQDDWVAYGGTQYASSADQASRSQQIAVAEKILKDKGTSPWATCALLSGLTSNSGSVNVDPGTGDHSGDQGGATTDPSGLPDPSTPAGTQGGDQDGTGTGSDAGTGTGSGTGSGKDSTGPSSSPTHGSGKQTGKHASPNPGKHTGKPGNGSSGSDPSGPSSSDPSSSDPSAPATPSAPADGSATPAPSTGTPDNPQQTVGSWNLVDTGALTGRHRGGNADESTANGQNDSNSGRHASREPGSYTVRQGDSLSAIADSLGVDGGWHALYAANMKVVGADPNHITAGQTLKVSDETGADQG
ncbi:LysM peptidoglycan-binding domain-containing protein [Streptomyces griseofuscus]|uniref:LysM peptidoglycan-binding domain-containing protein n=1 Tax=Streptomyces griseofuscus TaxID=146922 RepID=A0A7H1Q3E6_9ACTN|nr:transglycosylase family protein [Streptomyces griseofuscus]QNT94826.1 LysM peptidoglycan-binding domain-containing protein [Streptomyces griseofuscus]